MDKALKSIKSVLDNPRFTQETFDEVKSRAIENITISEKSAFDKLKKKLTQIFLKEYLKRNCYNN